MKLRYALVMVEVFNVHTNEVVNCDGIKVFVGDSFEGTAADIVEENRSSLERIGRKWGQRIVSFKGFNF